MKQVRFLPWLMIGNGIIIAFVALFCFVGNKAINTTAESVTFANQKTVIIDAGHGGIDGGATSCTGKLESEINLEIAIKLDDLFHLLGIPTQMIRKTDRSVYTQGDTIAAQKVSDLKNRVNTINNTKKAVLISIHQNHFSSGQYKGAQAFYGPSDGSPELARKLQNALIATINTDSKRKAKKATGIYLMEHITCPGVLLECGFLSNPQEEALLRSDQYQKSLCCVIATVYSEHLNLSQLS